MWCDVKCGTSQRIIWNNQPVVKTWQCMHLITVFTWEYQVCHTQMRTWFLLMSSFCFFFLFNSCLNVEYWLNWNSAWPVCLFRHKASQSEWHMFDNNDLSFGLFFFFCYFVNTPFLLWFTQAATQVFLICVSSFTPPPVAAFDVWIKLV